MAACWISRETRWSVLVGPPEEIVPNVDVPAGAFGLMNCGALKRLKNLERKSSFVASLRAIVLKTEKSTLFVPGPREDVPARLAPLLSAWICESGGVEPFLQSATHSDVLDPICSAGIAIILGSVVVLVWRRMKPS